MNVLAGALIKFVKGFVVRYLGTEVLEKLLIILLKAVVDRTDSKIDDKIYNAVFDKVDVKESK